MAVSRTIARMAALSALIAGSACVSSAPLSPYATPEGTDLIYRYGAFCGPGVPTLAGSSPQERTVELVALDPQDDIDEACKAHDICYELHGHDEPGCDILMQTLLAGARPDAFVGPEPAPCTNLVREIAWGFEVGQAWDASMPLSAAVVAYNAAVVGATAGAVVVAQQASDVGFPSAPGVCIFSEAHRAEQRELAAPILAQLEAVRVCDRMRAGGQRCSLGRERDRLLEEMTPDQLMDTVLRPAF